MRAFVLPVVFCLGAAGTVGAQAVGRVTGSVTGQAGQPLVGASVFLPESRQGARTGADGRYTIGDVQPGQLTVRVTMIGYRPLSRAVAVAAGQATVVDFRLEVAPTLLNEVVTVGYGTVRRSDLTGSTAPVRAQDIRSLPITSAEQALQGRAPGVQVVQNSGKPGAGFTVRIRGGNSMLGSNDPLYVVDGFPVSTGGDRGQNILSTINPDDIENIEVLKDASATAIYGARGANGVVMVTTKRGRAGTSRLEFESYVGMQRVGKSIALMNARQYAETVNEAARNQGGTQMPFPDLDNLPVDTDWQQQIFRSAPLQNYALSFSGGTAQTRYHLSGNLLQQDGIIRSSDMARGTVRFNLDSELNRRLTVSNQLLLARSTNADVPTDIVHNAFVAPPTVPVYDSTGRYFDYSNYPWWGQYPRNPVADANEVTNQQTNVRVLENFSVEYRLPGGLRAKTLAGVDYLDTKNDYYATRRHEFGGAGGVAQNGRSETSVYLSENTLTADRALARDQRVNLTGGFTWQHSATSGLSARTTGFVNDLLRENALGSGTTISPPTAAASDWTLLSWLGRANYALKDRYLFTVSGRQDGSSRFGRGNKWAFFPSAAAAWKVSQEPFLARAEALSNLKLRASWGRTGNQEIGLYNSLQRIAPEQLVTGTSLGTGYAPANIANPDLRWETTNQYNAGVDVGLWRERLTFTADVYVKNTTDLLARVTLPSSSGFSSILRNVGTIRNSGVELSLGGTPVETPGLRWTVDANVSTNRNRVVRLADGKEFLAPSIGFAQGSVHVVREGEPLAAFYGFREDGLDAQGNVKYVDADNDGAITDRDRTILGSPYPDFTYGFNTSITRGRLDLSATLQGSHGNQIFNTNLAFAAASFARGENQIVDVYNNRWTAANPDPNAKYPRLNTAATFRPSDRFIEDGSYLRLRNVRVGYRVPAADRVGVRDLLVYVSGQNLLTFTKYSWYDPEISQFAGADLRLGVDYFTYPQARTFTAGLRFGL